MLVSHHDLFLPCPQHTEAAVLPAPVSNTTHRSVCFALQVGSPTTIKYKEMSILSNSYMFLLYNQCLYKMAKGGGGEGGNGGREGWWWQGAGEAGGRWGVVVVGGGGGGGGGGRQVCVCVVVVAGTAWR